MRPIRIISLMAAPLALAVCSAALSAQDQQQPVRGFPADALPALARNEAALRAVPNADSLRARMRRLAEEPHEAGTERSRRVAEHILQRLRSFGLDAEIERFEALMPRPVARTLELIAPNSYKATLAEPPVAGDKDSDDANQIPTFNAYSPDGDVTAELVFVNYGLPEDYRILDSLGIDVEGKIVIAKYGRSWRGIKPKLAAEHGAVGCIIYSDPKDDGYFVDDVYTDGPMRPWLGVQRGSVMDMPTYPGDPLTPGWGAVEGARKLAIEDAVTLEDIPVLPVSYADALPFLRNLEGPVAPESWRGALPITYHIGPGPARVHLALEFDWDVRPLYDVIARVPGKRSPEQWIIYGNHHDAWVNGAEDPISGMVALEETARAVGTLLRTGWRPERTIVFAAWDGEEWGLLGSGRMGGAACGGVARQGGRVPEQRHQWPRLAWRVGFALVADVHAAGRARHTRSRARDERARCGDAAQARTGERSRRACDSAAGNARLGESSSRTASGDRGGHGGRPGHSSGRLPGRCRHGLHDRSARIGIGLHGFHRPPRSGVAQHLVRWRGERRDLPFHLRFVRLLHALPGYDLCVWSPRGANNRNRDHAAG
ncbi:MAG: M28 family peptidase [Gemmatimonadaceae bacterium]